MATWTSSSCRVARWTARICRARQVRPVASSATISRSGRTAGDRCTSPTSPSVPGSRCAHTAWAWRSPITTATATSICSSPGSDPTRCSAIMGTAPSPTSPRRRGSATRCGARARHSSTTTAMAISISSSPTTSISTSHPTRSATMPSARAITAAPGRITPSPTSSIETTAMAASRT